MGIESLNSQESTKRVQLTREEFDIVRNNFPSSSPEHRQRATEIMKDKGLEYNAGDVEIEVDGKKYRITTEEDEFGTVFE